MEDLGEKVMSSGRVLGALEYDGIPTNDRDSEGPDCQGNWDVPRADGKTRRKAEIRLNLDDVLTYMTPFALR